MRVKKLSAKKMLILCKIYKKAKKSAPEAVRRRKNMRKKVNIYSSVVGFTYHKYRSSCMESHTCGVLFFFGFQLALK